MMKTKRFISLVLVLVTLVSALSVFTLSTGAVSKYTQYSAEHGMKKYTFTVRTTGSWWTTSPYISFQSLSKGAGKAPTMLVRVYDYSTNELKVYQFVGRGWLGLGNCLYLKKNRTYDISILYLDNARTNKNAYGTSIAHWTSGYWKINDSNCVKFY